MLMLGRERILMLLQRSLPSGVSRGSIQNHVEETRGYLSTVSLERTCLSLFRSVVPPQKRSLHFLRTEASPAPGSADSIALVGISDGTVCR